ncbi:STN and carboxypeptidase regulatory-like domain-containing protein [Pedobacter sp. SYSU D00535]|uniref:STN and carboxypeptidase regulatory-like domain-containing protein n=1 Tax=Pedobacter sp. SYSU D00535 TaxID=2810308 RepID=UPI001A9657ED|nr:STN and carboxypeptidase regulatory-like domain-containing protein [Pedobacter sp. SYSU D00535]
MKRSGFFLIIFLCALLQTKAQHSSPKFSNLSRNISIRIVNQPLGEVLNRISHAGSFVFSYSGNAIKKDSVVSVAVQNKTVRHVLDELFKGNVEYKESSNYIILKSISGRLDLKTENIASQKNFYEIEGYVLDQKTGQGVKDASVYEKQLLKSTLTDNNGYFKLRFKGNHESVVLTVSKDNFRDTTIRFLSSITIRPEGFESKAGENGVLSIVERYGISRFLLSSRQRIQSLNIPGFLANSPFQASFLPGLSSHGMLSSQVVNKGSLNVLGGYTAGVDGVELAGLFNINKQDVKKVQAAGLFNLVGGSVEGVQSAGLVNMVLDSLDGVQLAGLINSVNRKSEGVQAAGLINRVGKDFKGGQFAGLINIGQQKLDGVQAAGLLNFSGKSLKGVQAAGLGNVTGKTMDGVQVAGLFNVAKKMHGTQVGLINIADTSSGYSIGLLNLVRKGYHKISISANEAINTNLSIKTGNAKLYTILSAGANIADSAKAYTAGLGLGHDFLFNNRLSLASELASQLVYLGDLENVGSWNKLQLQLQWKVIKGLTIFAGPSYSIYHQQKQSPTESGFKRTITPTNARQLFENTYGWLGYNLGITFM